MSSLEMSTLTASGAACSAWLLIPGQEWDWGGVPSQQGKQSFPEV